MNSIQYAFWLAEEAWSALVYYWPVTLALALGVAVTSILNFPFLRARFCPRHLLIFLPSAIALLILAWGSLMRHGDPLNPAPDWPSRVVAGLLISEALSGIGVVGVMKGYRWFSLFAVLLQLWIGVAFAFVAAMSVTNDWL